MEDAQVCVQQLSEKPTETNMKLAPDQTELILLHGANETILAMCTSPDPLSDSFVVCAICYQPYHTPNVDGIIESPVITACGHIFGLSCLEAYFASKENSPTKSCPMCRFSLQFKQCKHIIAAQPAFAETTPPSIKPEQTPDKCLSCDLRDIPVPENINMYTEERDNALLFVGFLFDGEYQNSELDRLDGLVSQAEKTFAKAKADKAEERRRTWHLNPDNRIEPKDVTFESRQLQ